MSNRCGNIPLSDYCGPGACVLLELEGLLGDFGFDFNYTHDSLLDRYILFLFLGDRYYWRFFVDDGCPSSGFNQKLANNSVAFCKVIALLERYCVLPSKSALNPKGAVESATTVTEPVLVKSFPL